MTYHGLWPLALWGYEVALGWKGAFGVGQALAVSGIFVKEQRWDNPRQPLLADRAARQD
jgi:hypothetical protein